MSATTLAALALLWLGPIFSPDPKLWIRAANTGDECSRALGSVGRIDVVSWRRLNRLFQSWRSKTQRPIHPRLLRTLAKLQQHFGGRRIELTSGYRVPDNPNLSLIHI